MKIITFFKFLKTFSLIFAHTQMSLNKMANLLCDIDIVKYC